MLGARDTVVNKTASCLHGYFSKKGGNNWTSKGKSFITQILVRVYVHTHVHTMHSLTQILRNPAWEEGKLLGHPGKNMNLGDWITLRWEKNRLNY